jgi:uncharacterized protein YecE (DUF72 family)
MGDVRIGPAGWSYADWKGVVYPDPTPKGFRPLEYLTQFFDTIEINSTFYRPPNADQAHGWVRQAEGNPRFKFAAKLWQRFTHERSAWPGNDEIHTYRTGIEPLANAAKLGAILVQFPWSFRRTPENRQWLARIIDAFSEYPLVVEVRHTSWDDAAFYDGLRDRNVAFCNIDQPTLRDCLGPSEIVTAPTAYVRLHGRNAENWFRDNIPSYERYNYRYSAEELEPWTKRIRSIRELAEETYVVTNNHYRGQAIINALEIAEQLGQASDAANEFLEAINKKLFDAINKCKRGS